MVTPSGLLAAPAYFGFVGNIDANGANRVATALAMARNSLCQGIHLNISSPGGTIPEGIYLYNLIRSLGLNLHIHNLSQVASIALVTFLAADRRTCSPNAQFHAHPVIGMPTTTAIPLRGALKVTLLDEQRIEAILRERTRLPNKLLNARRSKEVYFTAQEAIKYGIVDAVEDFTIPEGAKYAQI